MTADLLCSSLIWSLTIPLESILIWGDSTVALGWIYSDPKRWRLFVKNRCVLPKSWEVPNWGWRNPRVTYELRRMITSHWVENGKLPEEEANEAMINWNVIVPDILEDFPQSSKYPKLLLTIGWILRFFQKTKAAGERKGIQGEPIASKHVDKTVVLQLTVSEIQ